LTLEEKRRLPQLSLEIIQWNVDLTRVHISFDNTLLKFYSLQQIIIIKICLKGLVGSPKNENSISSLFTQPHVFPNLYVFICSAEHKGRYLEECFNQTE